MAQPILLDAPPPPDTETSRIAWWRQLTGYHWFVFLVASSAWLFDCLDQRLFSLARIPALSALMGQPPGAPEVQAFGKIVTAWFLIGWGVGGRRSLARNSSSSARLSGNQKRRDDLMSA